MAQVKQVIPVSLHITYEKNGRPSYLGDIRFPVHSFRAYIDPTAGVPERFFRGVRAAGIPAMNESERRIFEQPRAAVFLEIDDQQLLILQRPLRVKVAAGRPAVGVRNRAPRTACSLHYLALVADDLMICEIPKTMEFTSVVVTPLSDDAVLPDIGTHLVGRRTEEGAIALDLDMPGVHVGANTDLTFAPLELGYDFVITLQSGDLLTGERLRKAHSARLERLGFSANESGWNCLSDSQVIIPLTCPESADLWNAPLLRPVAGLSRVPRRLWVPYLRWLEGQIVDGVLTEVQVDEGDGTESSPRAGSELTCEPVLGECYDGPRKKIQLVGRHIVFHCDRNDGRGYYIVDSPLANVGLWLFRELDAALEYAHGGEKRAEAKAKKAAHLYHTGEWRSRLAEHLSAL